MSVVRMEVSTSGDELVILEQIDDRDLRLAIMDSEGAESDCRIRGDELRRVLAFMGGDRA